MRFKIDLARAATKLASRDLQTFPVFLTSCGRLNP